MNLPDRPRVVLCRTEITGRGVLPVLVGRVTTGTGRSSGAVGGWFAPAQGVSAVVGVPGGCGHRFAPVTAPAWAAISRTAVLAVRPTPISVAEAGPVQSP